MPRPEQAGARLLQVSGGYEGQVWDASGVLRGSHWWPRPPTSQAWQRFLRAEGLAGDASPPSPLEMAPLPRPWARNAWGRQAQGDAAFGWAWNGLAALWLAAVVLAGVDIWQLQQHQAQLHERIAGLQARAEPLIEARNQAEADRRAAEELLELEPVRQLPLMDRVTGLLPAAAGPRLQAWHYRPGQLRFTFAASNTDPSLYVKTFQARPEFTGVKAEPGRGSDSLRLTLQLTGEWP